MKNKVLLVGPSLFANLQLNQAIRAMEAREDVEILFETETGRALRDSFNNTDPFFPELPFIRFSGEDLPRATSPELASANEKIARAAGIAAQERQMRAVAKRALKSSKEGK